MIRRLHLPLLQPAGVIPHLGAALHWREGRSARCVAEAWFVAAGRLPEAVAAVLATAPAFVGIELLDGFLERCVELGDVGRPSQTDVMAICGVADRLAVIAVEAKVDESFGPRVAEWLINSSEMKRRRLARLCATLGLSEACTPSLRYQLLHRAASAVYEAQRYRSDLAVLLVQSFAIEPVGWADFVTFAGALGLEPAVGGTVGPALADGVRLHLGWVQTPWQ